MYRSLKRYSKAIGEARAKLGKTLRSFLSPSEAALFDHHAAQRYEIKQAEVWIKNNFDDLYRRIALAKSSNERWAGVDEVSEFFGGSLDEWNAFAEFIADKTCLDVGGGPCASVCVWWWPRHKMVLDPLAEDYKRISLEYYGKTWYTEDIQLYSQNAEEFISKLANVVDGVVVCRNTLDHCKDPMGVLQNIAAYAAEGCYLLLWTDLYHVNGHDEGHSNITRDVDGFKKYLQQLGFAIIRSLPDLRRDGSTINYGCVARKHKTK